MKPPPSAPIERIPALDGLRGCSALLIVAWHYGPSICRAEPGTFLAYACRSLSLAWIGVDLFFVLSGYLIMRILLEKREFPRYFRTFYLRRAWRIVPLYAVVLASYALALLAAGPVREAPWEWLLRPRFAFAAYLTFTQNFSMAAVNHLGPNWLSATWSLAVEEQFYLILPLVVRLLSRRGAWAAAVAGLLVAPACRVAFGGNLASYTLLPCRADALMCGALAALLLESAAARDVLRRRGWLLAAPLAAISAAALFLIRRGGTFDAIFGVPGTLLLSAVDLSGALVLARIVTAPEGRLARFLASGPLVAAGLCSYGLYLVHEPLLGLAHAWLLHAEPVLATGPQFAATAAAALASGAAAWGLYRALERPCMAYARRFRY